MSNQTQITIVRDEQGEGWWTARSGDGKYAASAESPAGALVEAVARGYWHDENVEVIHDPRTRPIKVGPDKYGAYRDQ